MLLTRLINFVLCIPAAHLLSLNITVKYSWDKIRYVLRTNYLRSTLSRFPQVWNCHGMNIWAFHRGIVSKYSEEKENEGTRGAVRGQQIPEFEVSCKSGAPQSAVAGFSEDSLSTIRKSKKEKPEKSWKLEINAKSSRYFFYSVLSRRLLRERWEDKQKLWKRRTQR